MSRIKISLSSSNELFDYPLNSKVNGFINRLLGDNNVYHGNFSRYSVSSLYGGVYDENGRVSYPNGSYFYISSDDDVFMDKIDDGLCYASGYDICGMRYMGMDNCNFVVGSEYDIVRCMNLIVREKDVALTYKDSNFIDVLLEKSKKKLLHCGYSEELVNTLSIELFRVNGARVRTLKIDNVVNICNRVMFIVRGSDIIRRALYEIGMGMCTGFGFGNVTLNKKR